MNRKKAYVAAGIILCFIMLGVGIYFIKVYNYKKAVSRLTYSDIIIQDLGDGEYIGECNVDFIYAKVAVTVKGGEITQISLLEHKHERGAEAERIIHDIVKQQSIKVDAVSGATNSSKVIMKAVENALIGK